MNLKKILLVLVFVPFIFLQACAYSIHEVHVSDFEGPIGSKPKIIEAQSEQFVLMGFVFDTNYVDAAYQKLQKKCSNGSIDGIATKYSTDLGFFSWTNRIKMKGICHS